MKRAKNLQLGLAAALAVVVGAQAADLPSMTTAPAAEYVKVCREGGLAGFAIPGSDACLKISGYVGAEIATGSFANPYWTSAGDFKAASKYASDIGAYTRGQVNFDALTNTAMGPLVAHVELRASAGDSHFDWASGPALHAAYVQWAGFTAGKHNSFYWPSP
jgi:hypothetical protein